MIAAFFYTMAFIFLAGSDKEDTVSLQVTEPDSIRSNFILRVEDLFWGNSLNYISLDRMSVKTGTRHYGFEGPQPDYLLDGIPFKPDYFGTSYSQLIPVPLPQINGLETREGMGASEGVIRQAASINFRSEPVPDGVTVFLSGQAGHNTGEPGPWVYDPEQITPNIERFGPWADAGVSLKTGPWYVKGTVRTHEYKRMDVFVQNRFKSIRSIPETGQTLEVDAITTIGLLETGWQDERFDVRLQAIRSDGKDFFFFQPLGREIPAVLETDQYSAFGKVQLTDRWFIRTLYQQRENAFSHRRNQFNHQFGLSESEWTFRASSFLGTESNFVEAGTEIKQADISGELMASPHSYRTDNLFLDGRVQLLGGLHLNTFQDLTFMGQDRVLSSVVSIDLGITSGWSVTLEGGYSELFPHQSNPIDYRVQHGYSIFDELNIPSNIPAEIENSRLTSFSLGNTIRITDDFDISADVEFVNHLALHVPFQPVDYSLAFSTFPGNYTLLENLKGQRLYTDITLKQTVSGRFNHGVIASFSGTRDGDSDYKNYWKTMPEQLVRYRAHFKPFADLELMMNIQYRGETTWEQFDNLEGEQNRSFYDQIPFTTFKFSKTTPAHLNIDFRISKWFWQQRLRGVLLFKNVLNRDLQYHPIGVIEDFGFMSRVEIRL